MGKVGGVAFYSKSEERLNVLTHGLGMVLSVAALVLLIVRAAQDGRVGPILSFITFGVSLVTLYAASTFYHRETHEQRRKKLQIVDHAAIYVLIAGTYTPFTLVTLPGAVGWVIFGITWGLAATGITLKLFFTGKFDLLSTLMYVGMGWAIIFAINPLMENLPSAGLTWLFAGGLAYTVGAVLYSIKKIPYNHAIFHVFVLAGSFCHFITILLYVLP